MLQLTDLLSDFETLCCLCAAEVEAEHWLDAFLLAAGANQVVEDYLAPDSFALLRAARLLENQARGARMAAAMLRAASRTLAELNAIKVRHWGAWQERWSSRVVDPLAGHLMSGAGSQDPDVANAAAVLWREARTAPTGLKRTLVRLPSCFQSFDQQLDDLQRLVELFAERRDPSAPLAVVGVRSSGNYLAPVCAALARARGYSKVAGLTMRPGRRLLPVAHERLRSIRDLRGTVVLVDDPPSSGRALAHVASALQGLGFRQQEVVILTSVFSSTAELPAVLAGYPAVVLAWPEWAIHRRLTPEAVRSALSDLIGSRVGTVTRLPTPERTWERGHVRALYRVEVGPEEREICVEGVGLGYFGDHLLAVAERLSSFVPTVYGVRDGLMYREWLPEESRVRAGSVDRAVVDSIADYAVARRSALRLAEDKSLRLAGRDPVWQIAGYLLEKAMGERGARPARPFIHAAVRRLLVPGQPAVIDGATRLSRWFQSSTRAGLLKVEFAERDFSNLDGFCCDPVYDLAGVDAGGAQPDLLHDLCAAYEQRTGEKIDAERWLLYRLVQLETILRVHRDRAVAVREACARVAQDYFAWTVFGGAARCGVATDAPICAIDLDGVLESEGLGFLALTPAAAVALRALTCHGYRPVLVTGRSLAEVRERCAAYGLSGGVAEYGAVVYEAERQQVNELLSPRAREDLDRVRSTLKSLTGVQLDERHRRSVRAYRIDAAYNARALPTELCAAVLQQSSVENRVRAIQGESQTDFVSIEVDKGTGLRAFAVGKAEVAMAIGDSASDLSMLALARRAYAPTNADAAVRQAGIEIVPCAFQLGFVSAVRSLLRHAPGTCLACAAPRFQPRTRLLLSILGAQDSSRVGRAAALGRITWRTALLSARTR